MCVVEAGFNLTEWFSLVYGLILEPNTAKSGRSGTDGVRGEEEKAQCG